MSSALLYDEVNKVYVNEITYNNPNHRSFDRQKLHHSVLKELENKNTPKGFLFIGRVVNKLSEEDFNIKDYYIDIKSKKGKFLEFEILMGRWTPETKFKGE